MFSDDLVKQASELDALMINRRLRIVTAESCTGGLVAALLTEVAGASEAVERGFVTYTNLAKMELLGVPEAMLAAHGAVSPEVAQAMATGALAASKADISVSVTGLAGPGGGTAAKPIGLVYLAAARRNGDLVQQECRFGSIGRSAIRIGAVVEALSLVRRLIT